MSSALSRSFGGLSASMKEEVMVTTQKQGIISLLRTGTGTTPTDRDLRSSSSPPPPPPLSLRRTLSADMSSSNWLNRDTAASTLKKIASSNELRVAVEEPEMRDRDQDQAAGAGLFDTWSAIMSAQKAKEDDGDNPAPPPYIHPLVRQSKSCLSEKSLEICTESLGSETGSDGFSSYPGSESEEAEEEDQEAAAEAEEEEVENRADPPVPMQKFDMEDIRIAKLNAGNLPIGGVIKKSLPRSFPPPIPSLARGAAAGSLHMRPHRDNGRLVLEAVSFPSQNNFRAQREDGRLVLTFLPNPEAKPAQIAAEEQQFEVELDTPPTETLEIEMEMEEEDEETEENEREAEFVKENAPKLTSGPMSVHRLAVMMYNNKPISRNPTWPKQVVLESESESDAETAPPLNTIIINHPVLTQSLPPRPPKSSAAKAAAGATASATPKPISNAYEHYWKSSSSKLMPTSSALAMTTTELTQNSAPTKNVNNININNATTNTVPSSMGKDQLLQQRQQRELVVKRGGDHFVPWIKGCKEPRRSLLFWEPHCIATS